ncbi:MAG: hypothetical protein H6618_05455 [Deltaproteobacteria bacterium]|nr:hypothetical protein [Deltaproteobacteria bacterium]
MGLCLFIETSLQGSSLALSRSPGDQELLWSHIHLQRQGSASGMGQQLKMGLRATGGHPSDIRFIVISRGPGSFTGIRSGLAFAKGFAAAFPGQISWLGLSATECAAAWVADHQRLLERGYRELWFFLPATRTHGYLTIWTAEGCQSWLTDVRELRAGGRDLTGAEKGKTLLVFAGTWEAMELSFNEHPDKLCLRGEELSEAGLRGMLAVARGMGPEAFSGAEPEPRYLRQSSAEENARTALAGRGS